MNLPEWWKWHHQLGVHLALSVVMYLFLGLSFWLDSLILVALFASLGMLFLLSAIESGLYQRRERQRYGKKG